MPESPGWPACYHLYPAPANHGHVASGPANETLFQALQCASTRPRRAGGDPEHGEGRPAISRHWPRLSMSWRWPVPFRRRSVAELPRRPPPTPRRGCCSGCGRTLPRRRRRAVALYSRGSASEPLASFAVPASVGSRIDAGSPIDPIRFARFLVRLRGAGAGGP
jgi:hypothetical protein